MQQRNLPKVMLVSNRPAINEVVEGVGLDRVFHRVSESGVEPENMREVPLEAPGDEDLKRPAGWSVGWDFRRLKDQTPFL